MKQETTTLPMISAPSAGQRAAQRVEQVFGAQLALGGVVEPVEVGALLGYLEPGAAAFGLELDGGDGDGDALAVHLHVVGVDDAFVRNDVLIERAERDLQAVLHLADADLATADAELHAGFLLYPARVRRRPEPPGLGLGIGEGTKHACRRCRIDAVEDEGGVGDGASSHRFLPFVESSVATRYWPRRSRRRCQRTRRSLIHCSARLSAFSSMRHVRTRPCFFVRTRPLASRTCRCWTTAGSDMAKGSASSLTDAGARARRSTIARRVGSASA